MRISVKSIIKDRVYTNKKVDKIDIVCYNILNIDKNGLELSKNHLEEL